MSIYFRNFPIVKYRFGDNEQDVFFQNLTSYVNLFEKIRDEVTYYTEVEIIDGERPDTLSYRLYGTVDYYWTFYFLNEKIQESGWPVTLDREYEIIREYYPYWVFTSESPFARFFPIGQIIDLNVGIQAEVIKTDPTLGQIYLNPIPVFTSTGTPLNDLQVSNFMLATTQLSYLEDGTGALRTAGRRVSVEREYEAIHHYEDLEGNYVDIDPFKQGFDGGEDTRTGKISVTWEERLKQRNNDLKKITVLRPNVVTRVAGEFERALRR